MSQYKIALIGNPNVGKTSLFNKLTNLRQKVGNYPGVTVEKREGNIERNGNKFSITDLPGTYSIYPSSLDEEVVLKVLGDPSNKLYPDLAVVIGEPSNLKRSILLYLQVRDLGVPAIFVINMKDEIESKGLSIDLKKLEVFLQTKIYLTNARTSEGLNELVEAFTKPANSYSPKFVVPNDYLAAVANIKENFNLDSDYIAWQYLSQKTIPFLDDEQQVQLDKIKSELNIIPKRLQVKETLDRNKLLEEKLQDIVSYNFKQKETFTDKIDKTLIHPVFGYVIFLGILLLIFQAVYAWSAPLMTMVEDLFGWIDETAISLIPAGPINDIITGAVIPGIEGVVVFVPQIAILFLFISIMEETGYMSRVVFLMDRWLKPFGLSGKSVVPLVSGAACAIPAVMSARNIENDKERLLTILVTPFMTCSARLPIYIVLISLVIPDETFLGLSYQAIALFVMYLLGVVGALGSAVILNLIIKSKHKSFLIMEMPTYKLPDWKNVILNVWEKTLGFLINAGKIIFAISIILWVLGTFGPGEQFNNAEEIVTANNPKMDEGDLENEIASYKLEHSYLGKLGTFIEPVVEPLGYDWKMGIGLISSFAAREVFVGTMSTVYSLGEVDVEDNQEKNTLLKRMKSEINRNTGGPAYNLASGVSLLLFYAFAMQCMSTIAIVKKETNSWKWTLIQTGFMTGLAYVVAFIAYQILK
ncbi:ferrous iron transport protein B [Chishuiella changwenlii]|uniref:Ferrous iron transport protein B n=1 Tax=Chishuiella changwenlii TaxID=1434701 RepID=A0A1M6Z1B1_9FLAO|nr:ferrous iron transport protein B [Chishuiella changwenlii]GGE87529.1 ferrous iron transport protein B [Chishuiella changwenlii]SHL24180.1 ferrous iron transport protein B [Chishuiella changwenlii]